MYGVAPVRMSYLPEKTEFLEATIIKETMEATFMYGSKDKVQVIYRMVFDYREGSWGIDVEDQLVNQFVVDRENIAVQVKEFVVKGTESRWLIQFTYEDVNYWIYVMDVNQSEIQNMIYYLFFSK